MEARGYSTCISSGPQQDETTVVSAVHSVTFVIFAQVSRSMTGVVKSMDDTLKSMNLEKVKGKNIFLKLLLMCFIFEFGAALHLVLMNRSTS